MARAVLSLLLCALIQVFIDYLSIIYRFSLIIYRFQTILGKVEVIEPQVIYDLYESVFNCRIRIDGDICRLWL